MWVKGVVLLQDLEPAKAGGQTGGAEYLSTWIHPYTPTHYSLGALFLSCRAGCCTSTLVLLLPPGAAQVPKGARVLHKYPAFVAPGAAQVPTGASFFAVFHASVSTGETEAKTEATNDGKRWWKNSFPALFTC